MARSPFLTLSPDLDLPEALKQIEAERGGQVQGAQNFGADQDQRLQQIYGQLSGSLQNNVKTTQGLYDTAGTRVKDAYSQGGQQTAGDTQQMQARMSQMAQQLGLDPAALKEVSGGLAAQATGFQFRNQQSMADRMGNIAQLGAGMSAVSQFAAQAAQQAQAQGRTDLSRKVMSEIQRANTAAASAKSDFTGIKATQAARAAADAEKAAMAAMKELVSEQKSAARSAASDARADARSARSDARRSSGGGGRGGGGGRSGGSAKWDPFDLHVAKAEYNKSNKEPLADDPYDVVFNGMMKENFGPKATSYIEARLGGKELKGQAKPTKGMNIPLLESYVRKIQGAKKSL